jgi:hypothetical protein
MFTAFNFSDADICRVALTALAAAADTPPARREQAMETHAKLVRWQQRTQRSMDRVNRRVAGWGVQPELPFPEAITWPDGAFD